MGYGFTIPDNPYDSVILKLPNDNTVYRITHSNSLPDSLLTTFINHSGTTILRDRLPTYSSRKRFCEGLDCLIHALSTKILSLLDAVEWDSPAGRHAGTYHSSQLDLLLLCYERAVRLVGEMMSSARAVISANQVLREIDSKEAVEKRKKKRRRKKARRDDDYDDGDEGEGDELSVVEWLSIRIHHALNGMVDRDANEMASQHLLNLVRSFHTRVELGSLEDPRLVKIHKRLKKEWGSNIEMNCIQQAWDIWEGESLSVVTYPEDVRDLIRRLRDDKVELRHAMKGEVTDRVILQEDVNQPSESSGKEEAIGADSSPT